MRWIGVSQLRRRAARALRGDPPRRLRAAAALAAPARRARRPSCRGRAEHGSGVIVYSPMASGMLTGAFDAERIAAARPGRLAPPLAACSRSRCSRATSSSSSACARSRRALGDDAAGARRRVGARAARRHRRRSSGARAARHVDGWAPACGPRARRRRRSREIDQALAETGAGTDDPPTPPPHIRPPVSEEVTSR